MIQFSAIKEDFRSLEVNSTPSGFRGWKTRHLGGSQEVLTLQDSRNEEGMIPFWFPKTSMHLPILSCSTGGISSFLEVKGCTSIIGCRLMSGIFTVGPMWVEEICPYQSLPQPRKTENGATWLPVLVWRLELVLLLLLQELVHCSWGSASHPGLQDTSSDWKPSDCWSASWGASGELKNREFLWMYFIFLIKFLLWLL